MPTFIFSEHPHDQDKEKWRSCLEKASKEMIDAGWNKKAKKFTEAHLRKARKLFYKK